MDPVERRDNVTNMYIAGLDIQQIPDNIFTNYKNVLQFDVERGLLEITENSFKNAFVLENLRLSPNNLTALNSNIFKDLKMVNFIDVSCNKIEKISPDVFQGLENLRDLYLDSNKIKVIEKGTFNNLNLDVLQLSKNELLEFDFQNMIVRQNFYLDNNLLTSLTVTGNITYMEADNNKISTINIETTSLEFLSVENNSITDLNQIKNGGNLKKLDVSFNQITNPVLKELTQLKKLDLSNNKLCCLTKETFIGLTNLEDLEINNNKGMKIESWEILKPLINLTEFSFDESHLEDYTFDKIKENNPKIKYVDIFYKGVVIVYDSIYKNNQQLFQGLGRDNAYYNRAAIPE